MTVKEILGLLFEAVDKVGKRPSQSPNAGLCRECLGGVFSVYYDELRRAYESNEIQ